MAIDYSRAYLTNKTHCQFYLKEKIYELINKENQQSLVFYFGITAVSLLLASSSSKTVTTLSSAPVEA